MPGCGSIRAFWSVTGQDKKIPLHFVRRDSVTRQDKKIPLGFARRDFVWKLQAAKKKPLPLTAKSW